MKVQYCITFDQDAADIPKEERTIPLGSLFGNNTIPYPWTVFDQGNIDVADNATFSEVIQTLSNGYKTMDWRKQHPNVPLKFEVKAITSI